MSLKILVFTAKWIGHNCVKHLIEAFPNDSYEFILCEPDSDLIIETLKNYSYPWKKIGPEAVSEVLSKPDAHYDWILNVWGSFIFKPEVLAKTKKSLNIHPSYLPYCRGRDPVVWAIKHDWPAGVTLHEITAGVDEGAIWYQEEVPYEFPITGGELYQKVADRCWQIFAERWADLRTTSAVPVPQKEIEGNRTFKRKELRGDQVISLEDDQKANEIIRRLMAHNFGPNYTSEVVIHNKSYRAVLKLEPLEEKESNL